MSHRDGYEHGVPSWIAGAHADPEQAAAFYTELFGWEAERRGDQIVCTLRGRDVAGFVAGDEPAWRTNVWVESADATAEQAQAAGGSVVTPPFDLAGVGRSAVLADPSGAVFTVSEPDPHRGAQVVNEPGAWAMSALSTPDLDAAKAFYGAVFGWETEAFAVGDMEATLWRLPGFEGGEPSQPVPADVVAVAAPGDEPRWDVDLWVADPDATAAKAAELGGTVLMPPTDMPIGRRAVLADPQGAPFSVSRVVPA
jgi:predicted enzyme related to lactoylglutathione lyase